MNARRSPARPTGGKELDVLNLHRAICRSADADEVGQGSIEAVIRAVFARADEAGNKSSVWLTGIGLSCDWVSLAALIDETECEDPDLAVFDLDVHGKERDAVPPLCFARLKFSLARRILDNPRALQLLVDSGWSAAVAEIGHQGAALEWSKHERCRRLFRPGFPNCTSAEVAPGFHYPVTDASLHQAICGQFLSLADRMGARVQAYEGRKARGWFIEDVARWRRWFGRSEATRVLEVSRTDGVGTNVMLDLLFPHTESEVHTVYPADETGLSSTDLELFAANAEAGGHSPQVSLYTGDPVEILAWMIAEDGYWESFDFIHFKPLGHPVASMTAAGQAWSLLKPGGVLVVDNETARFGEVHPAKTIMETLVQAIGNQADRLLTGDVIALRKRPPITGEGPDPELEGRIGDPCHQNTGS